MLKVQKFYQAIVMLSLSKHDLRSTTAKGPKVTHGRKGILRVEKIFNNQQTIFKD